MRLSNLAVGTVRISIFSVLQAFAVPKSIVSVHIVYRQERDNRPVLTVPPSKRVAISRSLLGVLMQDLRGNSGAFAVNPAVW
jgi:hypothetical protein